MAESLLWWVTTTNMMIIATTMVANIVISRCAQRSLIERNVEQTEKYLGLLKILQFIIWGILFAQVVVSWPAICKLCRLVW